MINPDKRRKMKFSKDTQKLDFKKIDFRGFIINLSNIFSSMCGNIFGYFYKIWIVYRQSESNSFFSFNLKFVLHKLP